MSRNRARRDGNATPCRSECPASVAKAIELEVPPAIELKIAAAVELEVTTTVQAEVVAEMESAAVEAVVSEVVVSEVVPVEVVPEAVMMEVPGALADHDSESAGFGRRGGHGETNSQSRDSGQQHCFHDSCSCEGLSKFPPLGGLVELIGTTCSLAKR